MAQYPVRVNLSSTAFPFLSELSGRSVIVKQQDQNYIAPAASGADLDKDIGIPALYYCHNVIATGQGYQAIGYDSVIPAVPAVTNFLGVFSVYDSATSGKAYLGYTAIGDFYYSLPPFNSWTFCLDAAWAAGKAVTTATVNGVTYIYSANAGCYKFDFGSHILVPVTLSGTVAANVIGIVGVLGYLVCWTKDAVAWSSLLDPTDFVPSLSTGAGGGSVQGARGDIITCVSHTAGFVVYTNQNAVAAAGSNNSRYPFNFREIVGSGGLASQNLATIDANAGNHFVYTSAGLQAISLQEAKTVIPELTDFLAGAVFEDFDPATSTFTITRLSEVLKKRLVLISERYLVISYGITELTHALVFDTVLRRWSKLKATHIAVFEFSLLDSESTETPRRSIAFLSKSGAVSVVRIDSRNSAADGVAILGKYQLTRNRFSTLQKVCIESVISSGSFACKDMYTLDGKTVAGIVTGMVSPQLGLSQDILFHITGVNHSLLFTGAFDLSSLLVILSVSGNR